MAEYIKREAVFKQFDNGEADVVEIYPDGSVDYGFGASNIRDLVNSIPAADVAPVVHGCFEPCFDENGNWRQGFAKCSNCGKEYYAQVINHFCYCSNCGAKLDGGADRETDRC